MIVTPTTISIQSHSVVMVDGSFDPLHDGHIEYFKAAAQLGLPVLCNISPDSWTRSKHPVLLEQSRRAKVLSAIAYVNYVLIGCTTTAQALQTVVPSIFAKGEDWIERGGVPLEEREICEQLGTRIMYLKTVCNSSSMLLETFRKSLGNS